METVRFWAIIVLLGFGVFFTLVSAVGVLRLPDVYARAHTASQTDTLGAGMALAAVALAFGWQHAAIYSVLLLFFVFITNPTAAHAIARSAAETGIEPWRPENRSPAQPEPAVEPDGGTTNADATDSTPDVDGVDATDGDGIDTTDDGGDVR